MRNGTGTGRVTRWRRAATSIIGLLVVFSFVLGQAAYAAGTAEAATTLEEGGVSLDFIAAGPYSYDHAAGTGGAFNDRTIDKTTGVVESLEGGDFACGDLVVFFAAITVEPDAGSGSVELDFTYDGTTTSGALVGFDDLVSASINTGDTGNLGLNGNESVTIESESFSTDLETTIQVHGVDGGEQIILRMVVELYCDPNPGHVTGNIQSTLDAARVVDGATINSGEQTIPLKQAGDILLPGLDVEKSCPVSAAVGDTITYTITVSNTSSDRLEDLLVDDPLLGGALDGFGTTLAAGASISQTFSYTVTASPDPLVNTVTATAVGASSNATVTDVAECTTDVVFPALEIAKVADAAQVDAGTDIGYTITVTNGGDGVARDVTLTDTLPADAGLSWSIDGGTGADDCEILAGVLSCTFDVLAAGASMTVHISSPTTVETCGVVRNSVSVTSGNDGSPSAGPVEIVVDCPGIDIEKTADAETVNAGTAVGFTIVVTNGGPGAAKDVQVSDVLPTNAGLSWSIDGGTGAQMCQIAGGVLTCSFGDMRVETSYTVHISSPTTTASCGLVDNTATVTIANGPGDSDGARITVTCPTTPPPPPPPPGALGIHIDKSGPELAHVGDTITYTMAVSLTTAVSLMNVVVSDPNCDAVAPSYVSGDDADFVLEAGEVWTYTCLHLVTDDDPDPLPNTATVTGTSADGRTATDSDDHLVDLIHPDVRIVKEVDPPSGQPGDTVTYSFTVRNTGDTTLYDVSVDDDVIGHIGDIEVLEPGQQVTMTVEWVLPADSIEVLNVGTAIGTDVLGVQVSDDDDAVVTIVEALTPPPTAFTGSEALRLGMLAALLLVTGLVALAIGRRRRTLA